jgi:hypothetical protein
MMEHRKCRILFIITAFVMLVLAMRRRRKEKPCGVSRHVLEFSDGRISVRCSLFSRLHFFNGGEKKGCYESKKHEMHRISRNGLSAFTALSEYDEAGHIPDRGVSEMVEVAEFLKYARLDGLRRDLLTWAISDEGRIDAFCALGSEEICCMLSNEVVDELYITAVDSSNLSAFVSKLRNLSLIHSRLIPGFKLVEIRGCEDVRMLPRCVDQLVLHRMTAGVLEYLQGARITNLVLCCSPECEEGERRHAVVEVERLCCVLKEATRGHCRIRPRKIANICGGTKRLFFLDLRNTEVVVFNRCDGVTIKDDELANATSLILRHSSLDLCNAELQIESLTITADSDALKFPAHFGGSLVDLSITYDSRGQPMDCSTWCLENLTSLRIGGVSSIKLGASLYSSKLTRLAMRGAPLKVSGEWELRELEISGCGGELPLSPALETLVLNECAVEIPERVFANLRMLRLRRSRATIAAPGEAAASKIELICLEESFCRIPVAYSCPRLSCVD